MKKRVKFIGASKESANWGSCDNPNRLLVTDEIYNVEETNIHSWHTTYTLEGFKGKEFPSTAFEVI